MQGLVWAVSFLLVTIIGLTLGCAGFIGMPISVPVQAAVVAMAVLVVASGVAILTTLPPAAPKASGGRSAAW